MVVTTRPLSALLPSLRPEYADVLRRELQKLPHDASKIRIVHAGEVILQDEDLAGLGVEAHGELVTEKEDRANFAAEVKKAFNDITNRVKKLKGKPKLEGILIAQQVKADLELVVGAALDAEMGPVVLFGTEEQQQRMIPPVLSGKEKMCFAVTEPNTGLDTTSLKTRAEKVDGGYRVNGEKIWITNAHVADKMLIIARTTALEDVKKKTEVLSLFYTTLDRAHIEHQLIPKMGRHAVGSNMLFITDLFIPEEDRIGEEGQGFKILLNGLNLSLIHI